MMQHTKYQGSKPYSFRQKRFVHVVPSIGLCKTCDPQAGRFWPQGYSLNKLRGGILGDATYQISRVSDKKIFSCVSL